MPLIRREIIIVVVPISAIREFIAVDIIGSTTFYYAIKLALKKLVLVEPIAIAGSIVLPILYKKVTHRATAASRSAPLHSKAAQRISLQD